MDMSRRRCSVFGRQPDIGGRPRGGGCLLGVGFDGGAAPEDVLGIEADYMQEVLRQIGNYGEVYARTIEPIGIARPGSLNALWTNGGLIYGPPFR